MWKAERDRKEVTVLSVLELSQSSARHMIHRTTCRCSPPSFFFAHPFEMCITHSKWILSRKTGLKVILSFASWSLPHQAEWGDGRQPYSWRRKIDLPGTVSSFAVWHCARTGVVNGYTLISRICPNQTTIWLPVGIQLTPKVLSTNQDRHVCLTHLGTKLFTLYNCFTD